MVTVTVLYPKSESSRFDHAYYHSQHMPLVRATWGGMGLHSEHLLRGTANLDGSAPAFELIGSLVFNSMSDLQTALAHAAPVLADIANFTDVQPLVQINEPAE